MSNVDVDWAWGINSLLLSVVCGPAGYVAVSLGAYLAGRIHQRYQQHWEGRDL